MRGNATTTSDGWVVLGIVRFYLALSVVVWHVWGGAPWAVNGYVSVLLFFTISGFYMSMVLNGDYAEQPLRKFYVLRALRLYPAYFAVLIVAIAVAIALPPKNVEPPASFADWSYFWLSNVSLLGLNNLHPADWRLIPPAWSLSVELIFYAMAPFVVRRPVKQIIFVFLCFLAFRMAYLGHDYAQFRYYPAGQDMCFFFLGVLTHRLWGNAASKLDRRWLYAAAPLLPMLLAIIDMSTTADIDRVGNWIFYLSFSALIPVLFAMTRNSVVDRFIGDLSYPIYISHWTVIRTSRYYLGSSVSPETFKIVCIISIFLAALAIYLAIDRPIEGIRRRMKHAGSAQSGIIPTPGAADPQCDLARVRQ